MNHWLDDDGCGSTGTRMRPELPAHGYLQAPGRILGSGFGARRSVSSSTSMIAATAWSVTTRASALVSMPGLAWMVWLTLTETAPRLLIEARLPPPSIDMDKACGITWGVPA